MRLRIVEVFEDFAKNTSLHGVKYTVLSTTSFLERIFWILILISSLTFAGYLTTLFWARYTSNPTRTTLKTAYAPTTTVAFPGVTICNGNKILESKVNRFLTKLEGNEPELFAIKNVFSYLISSEQERINEVFLNLTELDVAQSVLEQNDYADMRRIIRVVSQRCEDMIVRCAWNKKQVSCKDIFEESFTFNGRCCSFNYVREKSLKPAVYTLYYGPPSGLRLLLKPEHNKHRAVAGVTVIIHSPEDFPGANQNIRNHLSVGRVNYMQIDGSKRECSEEVKIVPIRHRQCLYSEEKKLDYFSKYSDSNCMSLCEAAAIYKQCDCVPYYFDFIGDKPICGIQKLPCLQNALNVSVESCGCLSRCEDEFYDVTMSSGKFIYNPQVWMMNFLDDINDTENSILLNVFFSTNRQSIWLRNTMTSGIYLISSFGGIYSLFLGCSIVTLIEILYYCFGKCVFESIYRKENRTDNEKHAKQSQKVKFEYIGIHTVSKELEKQGEYGLHPIMPFVN